MPFSCIIVDDDLDTLEQLTDHINLNPKLQILATYHDPILALEQMLTLKKPVDILFTDVEMPELNGIELAKKSASKFINLVLVSAHLHYALQGYNLHAQQFLTKPFDQKKFNKIIANLLDSIRPQHSYLMIRLSGKNQAIKIFHKDLIAIESASNYLKVHTVYGIHVPYGSIAEMVTALSPFAEFRRISRSFIINTEFISQVDRYKLILHQDLKVAVGETYQKDFDAYFEATLGKKRK